MKPNEFWDTPFKEVLCYCESRSKTELERVKQQIIVAEGLAHQIQSALLPGKGNKMRFLSKEELYPKIFDSKIVQKFQSGQKTVESIQEEKLAKIELQKFIEFMGPIPDDMKQYYKPL